jgi:hypothetical protein
MKETPDKLMSLFFFDQASMNPEQIKALSEWILQDPENARIFIQNSMFHRNIHESFVRSDNAEGLIFSLDSQDTDEAAQALNPEIWRLLSEDEKTAPSVEPPQPEKQPVMVLNKTKVEQAPWKINKFSIASAVLALAALLFIIVYIHLVPVPVHEEVATLTDTIETQWAESATVIRKGSRISTNTEPLMLRKGIAKLLFDNGISVLFEAPSEFVLITEDQVKLNYGRLYAVVPQQGIGFTVTTPNSKIIDLGTEFGVRVDFNETTELHVIKGKTTLVADQEAGKISLEVNEGHAKKISDQASEVTDIRCDTGLFVRQIQSEQNLVWRGRPLELADMVGGGNGLGTGKVNTGIRWEDGAFVSTQEYYIGERAQGTTDFIPVPDSPFVEGVFVPNSSNGTIQIAADPTIRWNVPDTPGQYCYNIHNSGSISRGSGRIPLHTQVLDGKLCGTPANPVISVHANAGVTFNLKEIRRYYQYFSLKSFTAVCGYSETFFDYAAKVDPGLIPQASFYILVDGQVRFSKVDMTPNDKACPVQVELLPEDHYLTLVVTGGADQKVSYDWCLYGWPRINIE